MVVGGQNLTCDSGGSIHMSAVRNDDRSAGAKIKWNTTIPPECISSVTVVSQFPADDYTPPNIMQTDEATLSGLRCDTIYNFRVRVRRRLHTDVNPAATSNIVSVHVGVPPTPVNVTAAATANGVVVSWGWNCGLLQCLHEIQVVYQPQGGTERVLNQISKSATSTTLQNLQNNTQYTLYIRTIGLSGTRARTENATLILERGVLTSTPFDGEITSAPNGKTTSSPSGGETSSAPFGGETTTTPPGGGSTNTPSGGGSTNTHSGRETTTTPSGGGTTITLSSRETPSGGQTTTTPSNQEPTTTPSISSVETTVGGEHPGRTPLPGTTGTSGMGEGNGAWYTTLIACMYDHFTGEEPLSFIPIVAAIGAAVVLILIGAVLVVVIIVLMR